MKRFGFLFFLSFLLIGCGEEKSNDQLVIGTSADYPPFQFYQDGNITGFEIELIKMVATELLKKSTIKDLPFESLIGALETKRVDVVASSLSETPERLKKVDFSIPFHESSTMLIVSKHSSIQTMKDLEGKEIGAQLGSIYEAEVKNNWLAKIPGLQVRSLSKIPDLLQDFKAGRLAAIVMGKSEAEGVLQSSPDLKMILLSEAKSGYAFAFPKGSPLVKPINKLLEQWKEDGTLKKLEEKWLKPKI